MNSIPYMYPSLNAGSSSERNGILSQPAGVIINTTFLHVPLIQSIQPNPGTSIPLVTSLNQKDNCTLPVHSEKPDVSTEKKKNIKLFSCVLYPPLPWEIIRTSERQPGCKTIECDGFPRKITRGIIQEVFEKCGAIVSIYLSKKNFLWHVKFSAENYAEEAIKLSGYTMRIKNKKDKDYCGKITVDFATGKEDDLKRHQLTLTREASIRKKLLSWIEHNQSGRDCNDNFGKYFSLLMLLGKSNDRLMKEKKILIKKLDDSKTKEFHKMNFILHCFNDVQKLFEIIKSPKFWGVFTRPQRMNIELLYKTTKEISCSHSTEMINERVEEDMELSETEEDSKHHVSQISTVELQSVHDKLIMEYSETGKYSLEPVFTNFNYYYDDRKILMQVSGAKEKSEETVSNSEQAAPKVVITKKDLIELREENKVLRSEYYYEVARNQEIAKEREANDVYYETLISGMENKVRTLEQEIAELKAFKNNHLAQLEAEKLKNNPPLIKENQHSTALDVSQRDVLLMTHASIFLNNQTFGAELGSIWSHLIQVDPNISLTDVSDVLYKFPNLFKEQASDVGSITPTYWEFVCCESDEE